MLLLFFFFFPTIQINVSIKKEEKKIQQYDTKDHSISFCAVSRQEELTLKQHETEHSVLVSYKRVFDEQDNQRSTRNVYYLHTTNETQLF